MENPKCPYCGEEMLATAYSKASLKRSADWARGNSSEKDTRYCFQCVKCEAESPLADTFDEAYAAAMKRNRAKGEWVHYKVRHSLPMDCPPYYGEEYDRETHSCLDDEWHCSNCDYITDEIDKEWMNFCPNCGTEMRKEANDER